jgi:hypothetical protein
LADFSRPIVIITFTIRNSKKKKQKFLWFLQRCWPVGGRAAAEPAAAAEIFGRGGPETGVGAIEEDINAGRTVSLAV